MLKKVYVTLEHEDCWTFHMPYLTHVVDLDVYPQKNYLRARILIESNDKEIIKSMRSHRSVVKVIDAYKHRYSIYVDFLNIYKGSVSGLLYDKEALILGNTIMRNTEIWGFVTHNKNIREIINEIKSMGKIVDLKVYDFNPFSYPQLTDIEKKILNLAYSYGYLDYPRRISASEIAKKLGLSKATFLYHLRNAEKKMIKSLLDNNYP